MSWDLNILALLIPLEFLLIGLTVFVLNDPYISRKHRVVMLIVVILSVILIAQNLIENDLSAGQGNWFWRTTAAVCGYTIRPVFLILFLYLIRPEKKHLIWWGLAVLNGVLHLTAYFSHLVFWIDETNHYQGGPLSNACLIVSVILLAYLLFESIRKYRSSGTRELLIPLMVVGMIILSIVLDANDKLGQQPVTFLTFSMVISSVFYYIWLHLRFVREHEDDLKAQQRIQIMLSQIQPHFLFNTLTTIRYLCDQDPQAAGTTTEKLTGYLRGNIRALSQEGEVPFDTELEHTRLYLEIEKVRFEDELQIEYDITCTDFSLPVLTLQPIAENAVRHGVRANENGGTVTIGTREYPDRYELTVTDDGPGFDPEAPVLRDDGHAHIGISNVRDRVRQVSGGTLEIDSRPGSGTAVTITIPKVRKI